MKNFNKIVFLSVIMLSCVMFSCKDDARETSTLNVTGEMNLNVPREGGVYYVTATSNDVVSAQANKIWCKAECLQGVDSNNLKITVDPNDGVKRNCQVVVAVYSLPTITVTIAQDGDDPNAETPATPQIMGSWLFDNPLDFSKAIIGNDLQLYKDGDLSTEGFTPIDGPTATKGAVRVATGSYFLANHGISANGETAGGTPGTMVNEYTLLYDYRLPQANIWYCFLQTDLTNESDGEIFVKPTGELANSSLGYSANPVPQDNQWHRLVIVSKLPDYYRFYIDGQLFYEGQSSALGIDDRYALDLAGTLLLGDNDGDDGLMDVSQITVWDSPLDDAAVAALGGVGSTDYLTKGALADAWKFNDPANLGTADVGNDLQLYKDGDLSTEGFTPVAGPTATKGAVRVATGSYFLANHGISANGETDGGTPGTMVNEYTLLYDYRLPQANIWYCFLQTNLDNDDDGEIFIKPTGELANASLGYSAGPVPQDNNWHRLVIVSKLPDYYNFYIDGKLFYEGLSSALSIDNRYALDLAGTLLLGDNDGDDGEMDISEMAIWRQPLTDAQVAALGTVGTSYPVIK